MDNQRSNDKKIRELALFAGAGGGILGGVLQGWRTVCAVEIDAYAASVLVARQNDGILAPFPIWDDIRTFNGRSWRGRVDVISGGFPCTDISAAGKGAGIDGEESGLWREMARIIGEVRPRYVIVENSPMLITRGIDRVLGDLASLGYGARWGIIGAHHAGALHKRDRIWIVANTDCAGLEEQHTSAITKRAGLDTRDVNSDNMADADNTFGGGQFRRNRRETARGEIWDARAVFDQPEPVRMVDGVAARVDRLKAIGNGQVPAVVRIAYEVLGGGIT